MKFDADEYREAMEQPEITVDGETYTGQVISIEQWIPLQPRVARLIEGKSTFNEARDLAIDIFRLSFSEPWYRLFWGKSVARRIVNQPPGVMLEALRNFFVCQERAMGIAPLADPDTESESIELQPATS